MNKHLKIGLVIIIFIASILQAFAIYSITTENGFRMDIAPYWFVGIFVSFYSLILIWKRKNQLKEINSIPKELRIALVLMIVFVIYSVLSAIIFPRIFTGIDILNPRVGIDGQYKNPSQLAWSFSNLGQAGYLIINFFIVVFLLLSTRNQKELSSIYKIYMIIGAIPILFGVFQHFSVYYFPNNFYETIYSITHNNKVYFSYPSSTTRTNSLFLEPSVFSGFAAMYSMMAINYYLYAGKKLFLLLNIFSFYCVLISLSTTGIASYILNILLTIFLMCFLFYHQRKFDLNYIKRFLIIFILMTGVYLFLQQEEKIITSLTTSNIQETNLMGELETQTIEKASTLSFTHRLWADQFSITSVLPTTFFLGAGLGSNRPSSFIAYIISNTGLIGFISFFGSLFFIIKYYLLNLIKLNPTSFSISAGFFAALIAMFGSLPDLNWPPTIWILGGLLVPSLLLVNESDDEKNQKENTIQKQVEVV